MSSSAGAPTPSVAEYVEDLRHTVTVAGLNYDIWWTYKEKRSRAKYVDVLNCYELFFQTSIHAHFVATIVALYRLYETRSDTFNIPRFVQLLELCGATPPATLEALRRKIAAAKPLWVKVCVLRNEAFAHRAFSYSVCDVFKKANASPNDIKELIQLTRDLLNDATRAWNGSSHVFALQADVDATRLLDDLTEIRGATFRGAT